MQWKIAKEEMLALKELAYGTCMETNAIYERLIAKGLASPSDGLVRASVAGEVVLEAIEGQDLMDGHMMVISLVEEPWKEPEAKTRTIEDFFD